MLKNLTLATLCLVVLLPSAASAEGIIFESASEGQTAGWKTVDSPSGNGTHGYWDNRSYDSRDNAPTGACSAGSLVGGAACDWKNLASPHTVGSSSTVNPAQPYLYYGLMNPATGVLDAAANFYFSGTFEMDWAVIFQLTAWDDAVEFGWYRAGNPDDRHAIYGPGGPHNGNTGAGSAPAATSTSGDFGFYYSNTRFGAGPGNEILFFTESRFNRVGAYFGYFSEEQFHGYNNMFEDEAVFAQQVDLSNTQQFAMFRQGDRYWFGLEDQFGEVTTDVCTDLARQPCADYDFNDFMLAMTVGARATEQATVPEPTSLMLLSGALLGVVWHRRRRM